MNADAGSRPELIAAICWIAVIIAVATAATVSVASSHAESAASSTSITPEPIQRVDGGSVIIGSPGPTPVAFLDPGATSGSPTHADSTPDTLLIANGGNVVRRWRGSIATAQDLSFAIQAQVVPPAL